MNREAPHIGNIKDEQIGNRIMGSLYDIGNFRYKHFTFFHSAETIEVTNPDDPNGPKLTDTLTASPNATESQIDESLKNFLNRVWPHKGLFIGDSSEGDYSFVTYLNQTDTGATNVQRIYIYKRVRDPIADQLLIWEQAIAPQQTLKPGIIE